MLAGVVYTLLLYKTRRLWPCIVAHALTNGLLGIHVLVTGEWYWWEDNTTLGTSWAARSLSLLRPPLLAYHGRHEDHQCGPTTEGTLPCPA